MAIKKKLVKKKTVTDKEPKEKKPEDEEDKNVPSYAIPEYKDPKIFTPKATLNIVLMAPITPKLGFQATVMITKRVEEIRQMIIDRHDGSIQDVTICRGTFDKHSVMDPMKTLEEEGVIADAEQ